MAIAFQLVTAPKVLSLDITPRAPKAVSVDITPRAPKAVFVDITSRAPILPREDCTKGWLGYQVEFEDGSLWKLEKALSQVEYQRNDPPFEARQVFECVCIKDPNNFHNGVGEAVAKIKYQVRGEFDDRMFYFSEMERRRENCAKKMGTKEQNKAVHEYNHFARLYQDAVEPIDTPHIFTTREIDALKLFGEFKCEHVPHLLSSYKGLMPEGVDEQAMPGGFVNIMLMNKLPGESLDYNKFWDKNEETREAIRRAFKVALMEVRKCALNLHDTALRNLIWDEKENKCYIIDFEQYGNLRGVPGEERAWKDSHYRFWGLAEECREC